MASKRTKERSIFVDDLCDDGAFNAVVLNYDLRPGGRPTNVENNGK